MLLIGEKKAETYKGLAVKADCRLHEQILKQLEKLLPPSGRATILDLGAGQGALSQRLKDSGYSVLAVDENQDEFLASGVDFMRVDFNDPSQVAHFLEKSGSSFDAVVGVEVVEHVENPWEYVRLMKKVLKPGGVLILSTPNITSWLSRLLFLLRGQFHQFYDADLSYGHIAPISEWEMRVILGREGFSDIEVKPGGSLPLLWLKGSLKWTVLNLMGLLFRPLMRKGIKDGWCLIFTGRKSSKSG